MAIIDPIKLNRLNNFHRLLEIYGTPKKSDGSPNAAAFARVINVDAGQTRIYLNPEKKGGREMGEKFARYVEKQIKLPSGWMDEDHSQDLEGEVARQKLPDHSIEQPSDKERISHPELKPVEIVTWENAEDLPDDQYAIVPRVRLKLSAGNGTMITEELPDAPLAFTTEWIKRKRVKRSNLVIVNATGDSMEPTICCGALLLIDTASTEIIDGKVYALRYGDELRVKRLYKRYDGGIIIRSDNSSKYPDETLTASDLNEHIYVIGRVIWQAGDL